MLFSSTVLYLPLEPILQAVLYCFCTVSSSTVVADLSSNLHVDLSADTRMLHTTSLHTASAHGHILMKVSRNADYYL